MWPFPHRARAAGPALLVCLTLAPVTTAAEGVTFALEGERVVAKDAGGAPLTPEQLVGTTLSLGDATTGVYVLRIEGVTPDHHPAVDLYEITVRTPGSDSFEPLCEPDPEGRTTAVAVPGFWATDGRFVRGAPGRVDFACTAGARGKCTRFGYLPWATGADGRSLAPHHAACVRMVRADYCGDGTPHTVPGVTIQMIDRAGVHPSPERRYGAFEAVWGVDGALCLARPRRPEFPLGPILERCPRLAEVPAERCDEAGLDTLPGALLANRS